MKRGPRITGIALVDSRTALLFQLHRAHQSHLGTLPECQFSAPAPKSDKSDSLVGLYIYLYF